MMRRTMPVIAIFMLIGAACAPARLLIPLPSATIPVTQTALPTNTPTPSALLTGTLTLTPTAEPSATQPPVLIPTFSAPTTGVRPTRTGSALLTSTQTLTMSPTGTPTAPPICRLLELHLRLHLLLFAQSRQQNHFGLIRSHRRRMSYPR